MARRVCKTCGGSYEYPAHRSLATRAHCQECATLGPDVRRVVERLTRRINRLSIELQELKTRLPAPRDPASETGE